MKKIKKLNLNKVSISSLTREQAGQIRGGGGDDTNETGYYCATLLPPTACSGSEWCVNTVIDKYSLCFCYNG